jgi:hypothetical protein
VRLLATVALGLSYDLWPVRTGWEMHLLDLHLLRTSPLSSIYYVHDQPPGYDVATAIALRIPAAAQPATLWVVSALIGAAVVVATRVAVSELGVRRWLANAAVVVGVVAAPAWLLYASFFFYTFWGAALASIVLALLLRYLRRPRVATGLLLFAAVGLEVLVDSLFQLAWMLAVIAIVVLIGRRPWREVLRLALLPLLVVGAWQLKDLVLFGSPTTSSWTGINLSRLVLLNTDPRACGAARGRQGQRPAQLQQPRLPLDLPPAAGPGPPLRLHRPRPPPRQSADLGDDLRHAR